MITEEDIVELITDDAALVESQDKLMTSAAQNMMVCLYRNQLLNVFVRVAMIAIPINSSVNDTLPVGKSQTVQTELPSKCDKHVGSDFKLKSLRKKKKKSHICRLYCFYHFGSVRVQKSLSRLEKIKNILKVVNHNQQK